MVAVAVTAQNTRLDDAESSVNWVSVGGGAGGGLETDFYFQGSNCFARKGTTGSRGIGLSDNANSDLSGAGTYETVMFKYICTTPGLLDALSVPGMTLEIGSGSTSAQAANRYEYDVQGSDTYPIDKSWLVLPINPNVAAHRSATVGTPNMTVADWYGLTYDQTGTSKSPNQAIDAVDIGAGLTLTGGDGASDDGTFQDFSDADWGSPTTGRFGYVREADGVFIVYGNLIIGSTLAAVFTDSDQTIIFPDGLFASGFSALTGDLQNAATSINLSSVTLIGKGSITGEDTRPVMVFTGASGSAELVGCSLQNFAEVVLTSGVTVERGTIETPSITQASASITGTTIRTTAASSIAALTDPDFANLSSIAFEQAGAGHAFEIDTAGSYNLDNLKFEGYGATASDSAAIDITATTGTVTLNVLNGGDTPTYKTAGAAVVVSNSKTLTITVREADGGAAVENARVFLEADAGGALPSDSPVAITRSGSTATVTHLAHGLQTGDRVAIRGALQDEYNGLKTITVTGVNSYTYTVSGSPTTPATGSTECTAVVATGTTNALGVFTTGFAFVVVQPVRGWVRKNSASPYLQQAPILDTITTLGLSTTVAMVADE